MDTLAFNHNTLLVVMSCLVALAAGFTGLSLTRNLSQKTLIQKKLSVALASVALGGGIWSMHFVAMLGLQLPVLFYYDAAITLISALLAILIVGAALILLHFTRRTPRMIAAAGALVGIGILVMHYIGMAGLELCRAIYTPFGIITSSVVAIGLCIAAFWIAYGQRSNRNILIGTVGFAFAVCSVHFLAMTGTQFVATAPQGEFGPRMSNEVLAMGVIFSAFVIFGGFLWVGITYLVPGTETQHVPGTETQHVPGTVTMREPNMQTVPATSTTPEQIATTSSTPAAPRGLQIPCERDGKKVFIAPADVALVRADGHYTQVYTDTGRLFCVWPLTEASKRLLDYGFLQTHRSFLVNPAKVSEFERTKDKGRCVFGTQGLPPAPVSRSKLRSVQDALALTGGATRAT